MPILTDIETIEKLKNEGKYAEARVLAEKSLIENTDDYRLYEELTDIALFEQNIEEAEKMISHARSLNPDSTTGVYLAGYTAVLKRDFSHAIELLWEANIRLPNNAEILRNLGWATFMDGHHDKGVMILRRAHNLFPEDSLIAEDLAVALIATKEVNAGIELLQKFWITERIETMKLFGLI